MVEFASDLIVKIFIMIFLILKKILMNVILHTNFFLEDINYLKFRVKVRLRVRVFF
jgi:hypothetical protein